MSETTKCEIWKPRDLNANRCAARMAPEACRCFFDPMGSAGTYPDRCAGHQHDSDVWDEKAYNAFTRHGEAPKSPEPPKRQPRKAAPSTEPLKPRRAPRRV